MPADDEYSRRQRVFQQGAANQFSNNDPNEGKASVGDETLADIPVLGWLSGSSGRRDAARNEALQGRQQRAWNSLLNAAPSADDLAVQYQGLGTTDEYGNLIGGDSAVTLGGTGDADQRRIMGALRGLQEHGGYTAADRAAQRGFEAQTGQELGANNQAALNSAYARGTGGSGLEIAARLSGAQGAATANAMNNAAVQQAAMQRALQAMQAQGGLAGQMNDQQLQRQQALNDYNQQQLNWRRGRSAANTGLANQTKESTSQSRQQSFENQERGVAGLTNQYGGAQQQRNAQGQRQDQQNQNAAGWIGSLLAAL